MSNKLKAKKYNRVKLDGVYTAKIRNNYIFRKDTGVNGKKFHHYLVYTNKYNGRNVAVETTHLYQKDPVRFKQLSQGRGIKMSLPGMDTPSLVMQKAYTTDNKGEPLDFANGNIIIKSKLSKSKTKRFFKYINSARNKKDKALERKFNTLSVQVYSSVTTVETSARSILYVIILKKSIPIR